MRGLSSGYVLDEKPYFGSITPTSLVDRSRYGNNGTYANITMVQLPSGLWARTHNGSSSTVTIADSPSLRPQTQLTMSCWVYPITLPSESKVIARAVGYGSGYKWLMDYRSNGQVVFYCVGLSDADVITGSGVIVAGAWQLLTCVYDGAALTVYKNGAYVSSAASTGSLNRDTTSVSVFVGSVGAGSYINGYTALAKISDKAVTPAQERDRYFKEKEYFGL